MVEFNRLRTCLSGNYKIYRDSEVILKFLQFLTDYLFGCTDEIFFLQESTKTIETRNLHSN